MSRIGIQPISVPNGVTIELNGNHIKVKGPKGELERDLHPNMKVEFADNVITVSRPNDSKENKSLHGLTRSLIANMVEGVEKGYQKKLEIVGVGYRATVSGSKITLNLGFSHPIEFTADGVTFELDEKNKGLITVSGIDKEQVGQAAAKVRSYRPPEPYKGKGIKYIDEYIIRKAGKAASKAG